MSPWPTPALRLLVGIWFQVCFTPLIGVLFTFPSRYSSTIGRQGVLRLGGWSPHVQTGFLVSRPTRGPARDNYPYGALTRCGTTFQSFPVPRMQATGLVHVRSSLLAESRLMSFPPANEIFQFAGFASRWLSIHHGMTLRSGCPIRISKDQSLRAAPHGFSQRVTSFIASWHQGIHQMPF